jgi:hypothetical protein
MENNCIELRGGGRSSNDDLGINQLLVEGGVLALLVRGGHQGVTLVLEPLADTELILSGTQKTGLLLGVLATLEDESAIWILDGKIIVDLRRTEPKELYPEERQMRLAYVH